MAQTQFSPGKGEEAIKHGRCLEICTQGPHHSGHELPSFERLPWAGHSFPYKLSFDGEPVRLPGPTQLCHHLLCDRGQSTHPLCASASSSVKWGQLWFRSVGRAVGV